MIQIILKTGITGRMVTKISPENLPVLSNCKSIGCLKHLSDSKSVVIVIMLQRAELGSTCHTSIIPKFNDPVPPMRGMA